MFSLIAMVISYRRERAVAVRVASLVALAERRMVANDDASGKGFARAA